MALNSQSGKRTVVSNDLNVGTIQSELTFILKLLVVSVGVRGETPFTTDNDLLSTGELEFTSSEGFNGMRNILFNESYGIEDLVDFNSSDLADGFTESTSHTSLKSISTGAGKHFVDTENVPRVNSASKMETFLTALLDQVFVGSNTGSFQTFRTDLFLFEGDEVNTVWEFFNISSLFTSIVDSDSCVRDTSVITRLGEWLATPVSVASSGSSSHFFYKTFWF